MLKMATLLLCLRLQITSKISLFYWDPEKTLVKEATHRDEGEEILNQSWNDYIYLIICNHSPCVSSYREKFNRGTNAANNWPWTNISSAPLKSTFRPVTLTLWAEKMTQWETEHGGTAGTSLKVTRKLLPATPWRSTNPHFSDALTCHILPFVCIAEIMEHPHVNGFHWEGRKAERS